MHLERLRLTDFRNYAALDLPLAPGLIVFQGRNAQGKSNVLEAVSLLATTRSFRTSADRETVRWGAPGRFARLDGTVARRADRLHIEVVITDAALAGEPGAPSPAAPGAPAATGAPPPPAQRKRIKVNGTPRRAMDLLGMMTAVVFTPHDLDLVVGEPSQRRRFLDLTLCQVRPAYCRALSQYQKVLAQRSALLRRIRDGEESPAALAFWDEQLAQLAAPIMRERAAFLGQAEVAAARVYATLARDEHLPEDDAPDDAEAPDSGAAATADAAHPSPIGGAAGGEVAPAELRLAYRPSYKGALAVEEAELVAAFRAQLVELRRREIAQGVNVLGPHRDDLAFLLDMPAGPVDLAIYGSRGQQRSVALALKLAELEYIEMETGDQPILLLDDVLSELDAQRRADLLLAVRDLEQVLLTTTDLATLPPGTLDHARVYDVRGGRLRRAGPI
ncbi:MAG TPA: DNA replication/repair protein RecF [Ktedonobacterales bacterium]|nr:DNA replication/repair protein RecF [Ktedonobacterales bacterium]